MTLQDLKKTLIQTTRALSGKSDLQVHFGEKIRLSEKAIHLPDILTEDVHSHAILKGQADRLALTYRYGYSQKLLGYFEKASQDFLYSMLVFETALTELKGVQDFPGVVGNLQILQAEELSFFENSPPSYMHEIYALSLKLKQNNGQNISSKAQIFLKKMDLFLTPELEKWFEESIFKTFEDRLQSYTKLQGILQEQQEENATSNDSDIQDFEGGEEQNMNEDSTPIGESESLKEMDGENLKSSDVGEENDDGYSFLDMDQAMQKFFYIPEPDVADYKVFTKAHDAESSIGTLVSETEKKVLKNKFQNVAKSHKGLAKRLTVAVQEKLLSSLKAGWRFDQEEGVLDAAKLASFIASGDPKIFRLPHKKDVMDTAVTLLVDNSGSMRGRPIEMAALTTDVLARTLDRCRVNVEVLGFTTKSWKGGESRLDWVAAGRPENAGRLNDLLHVIYKPANVPYNKCKDHFAYMLADDILKENIDGESLQWAYKRLIKRSESRKILIVISDGAPVDYATDRHNKVGYLDRHLKDVIAGVERNKSVELLAIGIGHDVDDYYKNAVVIESAETLGDTLLNEMVKLFDR